jgi:diguanylate cyclase (GGDEF)-like protein/PAS domain S-box-containing protein
MAAMRGTNFGGEPAVIASMVDLTARKITEAALRDSQQRYRQLFEAESDALLLIENETGRIIEANTAASRLYGYSGEELRWMRNHELSAEPEATEYISRSTPVDFETVVTIPLRHHRRRDGSTVPVEITGRFFELGGRGVHLAAIRDISARLATENALRDANSRLMQQLAEIEALQVTLKEQAMRDPLTGLYNRRFFEEACANELARAQREGYPVALAMFDVDHFKAVNDTYGHAAGDEVLIAMARLLRDHARVSDVACRYGGEEFMLLLPHIALEDARARVEQLRQECADSAIAFGSFRMSVTVSIGLAAYPAHGLTARELIGRADEALYRAKNLGRNQATAWEKAYPSA